MLGAIAGDIIGSIYEAAPIKSKDFPLFGRSVSLTNDTVCTIAIADALLCSGDFAEYLRAYIRRYPGRGYGGMFVRWAHTPGMPAYGSSGNGAAMRVSAIAWLASDEADALATAARTAAVSHDHPDAIAGAQAAVLAAWLARHGAEAETIRREIAARFAYDLSQSVEQIRAGTRSTFRAKARFPPRSCVRSRRPATRTRSATRCRSAATVTRSPASRAASPRRSMACRLRLPPRPGAIWTTIC